jgi:zinc protease
MAAFWLVPGSVALLGGAEPIPRRPELLRFSELEVTIPEAKELRHELANGAVVFVVEDHLLPLVDVVLASSAGDGDDPPGKAGLASLTATMIRQGGTRSLTADELDEGFATLGAEVGTFGGGSRNGAYLACTRQVLDRALPLFLQMVREPAFQEDRLRLAKKRILSRLEERNDDPLEVLEREWRWLFHGMSPRQELRPADLEAIEERDLSAYHRQIWRPETMVMAISGDVATREILSLLEKGVELWSEAGSATPERRSLRPEVPDPGFYHVEHPTPQTKVLIGHPGPRRAGWSDPDEMPLLVLSEILGGRGAVSRLRARLRAQEHLVYRAWGGVSLGNEERGEFRVFFETEGAAVPRALEVVVQELIRLQEEDVLPRELALAKDSLLAASSLLFESAKKTAGRFAEDELLGRPHAYWTSYRSRLKAVGAEDVRRVARAYLHPHELVVLVVGPWSDLVSQESTLRRLTGAIRHLPARDPVTLEPVAIQAPKTTQAP